MHSVAALPGFRTYDPLLEPIAAKVQAGTRLDAADGLALYRSKDILAVGWLANFVRERMHGDITYFSLTCPCPRSLGWRSSDGSGLIWIAWRV